ncbi:MAG TPA: PilZ domain-containing protein [Vicinamibacterales bacterium]|nr:PilZ domain-containing protein [Vicinamibacterales bacterium]
MSTPCTVIIGAIELLDALQQSAASSGEVLTFSDTEPIKAIEAIAARKPEVVSLERLFAATSRGAALINRIKADPALSACEIRVVSIDGTYRVSPRRNVATSAPPEAVLTAAPQAPTPAPAEIAVERVETVEGLPATPPPAQNLDYRGTRRAPRVRMADGTEAQVDGALATIVDLSTYGAQILCPTPLKPQQTIRMVLADDLGMVKFAATVAWAFFEIPKGVSRYRAGIEFKDAESKAVDAFGKRHAKKA